MNQHYEDMYDTLTELETLRITLNQTQILLGTILRDHFTHIPEPGTDTATIFLYHFPCYSELLYLTDDLLIGIRKKLDETISDQYKICWELKETDKVS